MHAVVLAGGKGTRLRPYTAALPKPLVPIGGRHAMVEVVLHQLAAAGFRTVSLATGHLGHIVRACVGDGSRWGLAVSYEAEEVPLGTMGPVVAMLDRLPEHFLVLNCDILTDLDFGAVLRHHRTEGAALTVAARRHRVELDFGVLATDGGRMVGFTEKPSLSYQASMGVYGMSRTTLDDYPPGSPLGFDRLSLDLLAAGTLPAVFEFDGYWLDIGRPDDYDRANAEFELMRHRLIPPPPPGSGG
ncbi:sugar phosphate nucleotidyltransferase [Kitasatospora sp. NPDC088346]|uniref:sugar phosphate nucleotidyltransferase n=1 Tax=Kitasatospora sp. NPDC088346 TaxID=3364073 RepID=UPI00381F457F